MFVAYSPASNYGYMYGVLLLIQKVIVIWIIGSTVKSASAEGIPEPASSSIQLYMLAGSNYILCIFLIWQFPFNERFENLIQTIVSFCQGAFFTVMGMTAAGEEANGGLLNNINLAAMTVVIVASMKGQIISLRKSVMKAPRTRPKPKLKPNLKPNPKTKPNSSLHEGEEERHRGYQSDKEIETGPCRFPHREYAQGSLSPHPMT